MPKPITPIVGVDVFVVNTRNQVCLIQRADNKMWALPGGRQDLGETPKECGIREFKEETGLSIKINKLLWVFSSERYAFVNYKYKNDKITHILFAGELISGRESLSDETINIGWFKKNELPGLSYGHSIRIRYGFKYLDKKNIETYFE